MRSVSRRFAHVSFDSNPVCQFHETVLVRLEAYVRAGLHPVPELLMRIRDSRDVNRRYNDARSTIITTDRTREELADVDGWRV